MTFLPEREAATVVGLSHRTLSRYRVAGDGSAFHKSGFKVLYLRFDPDAWIKAKRPRGLAGGI